MWIANQNEWDRSHSDLSKYFIERIKQQVDFEETISNRHKSTNGYTLIKEIVDVCILALKREKSINRLISLVTEAKSELLQSSIINDYILKNYYSDVVEYYSGLNPNKLKDNQKSVSDLLNKSMIHFKRLDNYYFNDLITDLQSIDFKSNDFIRFSNRIDLLINCAVPYLINKGYSTTSISDIAYRFIRKSSGDTSGVRILNKFRNQLSNFEFVIKTQHGSIEMRTITEYLGSKDVQYIIENDYSKISDKFQNNIDESDALFIVVQRQTIDPHNYLRNLYEISLKKYVISKSRQNLSPLNDFFERVFWRFDGTKQKFEKSNFNLDPLNVTKRKSTLFDTLLVLSKSNNFDFDDNSEIPLIESIADSIYYYNLAIGSKSIENSLSLLWTSLETLLPYRLKDNDITNIQYFVSKNLSIGAVGREITAFATRYNNCNWINSKSLDSIGLRTNYINYTNKGLKVYYDFLSRKYDKGNDPFDTLKSASQLLCKEFCRLNDIYTGENKNTASYWINRIKHSEESIHHQLDRIYLHRNQVVHSGKFINEYSNLWNHLEWYIGKLLSFAVLEYLALDDKSKFDKKSIFMNLEAYTDNTINLLKLNKDKAIHEIPTIAMELLVPTWQFF